MGAQAHATFIDNLNYACTAAAPHDITVLIEPLNAYDAPGYFLQTTTQAVQVIEEVGLPNLKLMFDCYHVQLMEGDLSHKLAALKEFTGHIQFANVPDRGPPDQGEVNYAHVFALIENLGYDQPIGAEYKPKEATEGTLSWMKSHAMVT